MVTSVSARRSFSFPPFVRTSEPALQSRRHDPIVAVGRERLSQGMRHQKKHEIREAVEKRDRPDLETPGLFRR